MLDDLSYIHERDVEDTLGIAEKQPSQLTHEFQIDGDTSTLHDVHNIVYAAMGGSALAATLVHAWPKLHGMCKRMYAMLWNRRSVCLWRR